MINQGSIECLKCKKLHNGQFGSGKYCSRQCANSRQWSNEINSQRSKSNKKAWKELSKLDQQVHIARLKHQYTEKRSFEEMSPNCKKKVILREQNNKCLLCGISSWQDNPLTLQLDHIDGNNQNNERNNLRCICPNCHSQTKTYCGKNRSGARTPFVSDEVLLDALQNSQSIKQALRQVGYSSSHKHHYERCRRIINENENLMAPRYNWELIQQDHNDGLTWQKLQEKHGVSLMTLNKAKHAGKFISRKRNHKFL